MANKATWRIRPPNVKRNMAIRIARTMVAMSLCFDRILRDRPGICLMDIEWSSREDNVFRLVAHYA